MPLRANRRLGTWLVPFARAYIRFSPTRLGKTRLWRQFAWRHHLFVVRTYFGSRVSGDTSDMIQRYIYYCGTWEPRLSRYMEQSLREGDTFIDVGSHVGFFSLLAAHLVGESGHVVALEAAPAVFERLERNLALNARPQVARYNVAATRAPGEVCLYQSTPDNSGESSLVAAAVERRDTPVMVRGARLDELLGAELRRCRMIKIDVEGAEWMAVEGMMGAIAELPSDCEIVVEISPKKLAIQGKSPQDVLRPFFDQGFAAYDLRSEYGLDAYLTDPGPQCPIDLAPIMGEITEQTDVVLSRRWANEEHASGVPVG